MTSLPVVVGPLPVRVRRGKTALCGICATLFLCLQCLAAIGMLSLRAETSVISWVLDTFEIY